MDKPLKLERGLRPAKPIAGQMARIDGVMSYYSLTGEWVPFPTYEWHPSDAIPPGMDENGGGRSSELLLELSDGVIRRGTVHFHRGSVHSWFIVVGGHSYHIGCDVANGATVKRWRQVPEPRDLAAILDIHAQWMNQQAT
jgi:hypothetical protein